METTAFLGMDALNSASFLLFLHLLQVGLFVVLIRHLDLYEREPLGVVLAMFVWGGLIATSLSIFGNALVDSMLDPVTQVLYGPAITAPLVEESAKGLALVLVFAAAVWLSRRRRATSEFGGVTDGIVYGAAVGFGFAFVENIHYFVVHSAQGGSETGLDVLLMRADFGGLGSFGHALYSACLGAGLGYALWCRGGVRQFLAVAGGLASAMALHAAWNGLSTFLLVRKYGDDVVVDAFVNGSLPDAISPQEFVASMDRFQELRTVLFYVALLAMAALFAMWLRFEGRIVAYELAEEANSGLITAEEYRVASSIRLRYRDYYDRARRGKPTAGVRELHDRLTEFAMTKWRTRLQEGDQTRVARARAELALLRSYQQQVEQTSATAMTTPAVALGGNAPHIEQHDVSNAPQVRQ